MFYSHKNNKLKKIKINLMMTNYKKNRCYKIERNLIKVQLLRSLNKLCYFNCIFNIIEIKS